MSRLVFLLACVFHSKTVCSYHSSPRRRHLTCLCIYHSGLYTGLFAIVSLPLFIFPQKLPECFCLPRCPMGKNSCLFIANLPSEIFVPNLGACCPMQRALAFSLPQDVLGRCVSSPLMSELFQPCVSAPATFRAFRGRFFSIPASVSATEARPSSPSMRV